MADDQGNGEISYVKEAIRWQYNWIAMAGAAAFALVSGSALPLILGAGVELIYLSTVPQNKRFQRLVRSWKYADEKLQQERSLSTLFYELPPEMRVRYVRLENAAKTIRENYSRLTSTSRMFVDQMESKLQGLSQSYVRLLNSAFHHREYLKSTNRDAIRKELEQLRKALPSESPKVQEINSRRIDILSKRVEKFEKIQENTQVVDAQCLAIEDVLELIRDQSVTMHDPRQIGDHLDSLVKDVEQTEATVREVESIFELSPIDVPEVESGGATRSRVRNG
jgi:hypothetical protein